MSDFNNCCSCLCRQIQELWLYVQNIVTSVSVGTTTTLAPGSPATVTNSGTPNAAVLNFGIPAGDDGDDGVTPHIGANGNWFIGNTDTGIKAVGLNGTDGTDGTNGLSPTIGANGNWFIGTTDTGVHAQGSDGVSPTIGANGNWFIGLVDTGVKASGTNATVSIGLTTTLPAGSPASVSNTGTPSAAVFNFGIPKGETGGAGSGSLVHASLYGILLNDVDMPTTIAPGGKVPWKTLNNNGTGLITTPVATPYFQFTKTGRYMCTFSLRCATKVSGDNGVVNWGVYALGIKKAMVTSASAFVTPHMTNISGIGIFDVTDVNEKYNLVNNSKVAIQAQGATSTQVTNTAFKDFNGVNVVDGMSCVFLRIGEALGVGIAEEGCVTC